MKLHDQNQTRVKHLSVHYLIQSSLFLVQKSNTRTHLQMIHTHTHTH